MHLAGLGVSLGTQSALVQWVRIEPRLPEAGERQAIFHTDD